jgi:signal transduction histidine kinase
LVRREGVKNDISLETRRAEGLPLIEGDRVQLQQVILNLIVDAIEAMTGISEGGTRPTDHYVEGGVRWHIGRRTGLWARPRQRRL